MKILVTVQILISIFAQLSNIALKWIQRRKSD